MKRIPDRVLYNIPSKTDSSLFDRSKQALIMEFEQPKKINPPLEEEGPILNCSDTYIYSHTCSHKYNHRYTRQNIVLALWHLFLFF
jgi:hypothetical protein